MIKKIGYFLLFGSLIYAQGQQDIEEPSLRRVEAYFLLGDINSAFQEAKASIRAFPDSKKSAEAYIEAAARMGLLSQALAFWEEKKEMIGHEDELCEKIGWAVLEEGIRSSQYAVRLTSLIGAALTHDAKAIPYLLGMMKQNNKIFRSVAIQMAVQFRDEILQREIERLLKEEQSWMVRLQAIRACGQLQMKSVVPYLKRVIASEHMTYEEKALAIEALIHIYEEADREEISLLAKSSRAGMRCFACEIASHFQVKEAKEQILFLLEDPRSDVRIAAWNAIGLYYRSCLEKKKLEPLLKKAVDDPDPTVAITAAWVALFIDPPLGEKHLSSWLQDRVAENRRLAAAAISAAGVFGEKIAKEQIGKNQDPYVLMNLALGLLGQKVDVQHCCDILFKGFRQKKEMWMWESQKNRLFRILGPSHIRHLQEIPHYPEAVDTMTTLHLLSFLSIMQDTRASEAVKQFLQKKGWGVTGFAAATLLQEGDQDSLQLVRSLLEDKDIMVRVQAALVLSFLGKDPSALSVLREGYEEADYEMKACILEALGRVQERENVDFLIENLKEPFALIRIIDASSLLQTIYH